MGPGVRYRVGECSLGAVLVAASAKGVCAIFLGDDPGALARELEARFPAACLAAGQQGMEPVVAQVAEFIDRPRARLPLPLDMQGTPFQQKVWQELCRIPFGTTRSYSEIAEAIGEPHAVRAVAAACAANKIAVAIPCHRAVRRDGALSGYRWGASRKARLLQAEQCAESEKAVSRL